MRVPLGFVLVVEQFVGGHVMVLVTVHIQLPPASYHGESSCSS